MAYTDVVQLFCIFIGLVSGGKLEETGRLKGALFLTTIWSISEDKETKKIISKQQNSVGNHTRNGDPYCKQIFDFTVELINQNFHSFEV